MVTSVRSVLIVAVASCFVGRANAWEPVSFNEKPIIEIDSGKVMGNVLESRLHEKFFAFRGIRYAKPPVGELRFKAPENIDRWNGTFDATADGPVCMQRAFDYSEVSEDCLRLNVYTRDLNPANPKPVIFFIHPGGFNSGSAQSKRHVGPQTLMDREVVFVSFNYRLGSLGFLALGTKESPGNCGMKDQVAALRWVQRNIRLFGGDPNSVTLFGVSAGATSAPLHMVSPMSAGLFHRVIAMSGAPTAQWKFTDDQIDIAQRQARLLNCTDDSIGGIYDCLMKVDGYMFGWTHSAMFELPYLQPILSWKAVIEPDFGQERFLTEDPNKSFSEGRLQRVPVIVGVTEYEFLNPAIAIINDHELRDKISQNFTKYAPIYFLYERDTHFSKAVTHKLTKTYLNGSTQLTDASLLPLGRLFADSVVKFKGYRFARLASAFVPVYYYSNRFVGRYSHTYYPDDKPYGTVHLDDMLYLVYVPDDAMTQFTKNDPEDLMCERLTRMWTAFAYNGNPNSAYDEYLKSIHWEPFNSTRLSYLDMGNEFVMKDNLNAEHMTIWDDLFPINYP